MSSPPLDTTDPTPSPSDPSSITTPQDPTDEAHRLLARPPAERAREFKYRLAQSLVFGLPVIALQLLGHSLGGPDAPRWVGLIQALLTTWILYVAAAGLFLEGLLLKRPTPDLLVATTAATLYLYSAYAWLMILLGAPRPMLFHWTTLLLILWSALQYSRWDRAASR